VGIAAHVARLRTVAGHELLLVPSVPVLPAGQAGRVLLIRQAGHDDDRGVLGGAVDAGEPPAAAAVREAREEISAGDRLVRLADVPGGPMTRSATPTATAPPTSPPSMKPGSSAVPRHPVVASLASSPGSHPQNCPACR
jgi:8-oxo-dGTP pyrophosphatase MutT (NUDIX family)